MKTEMGICPKCGSDNVDYIDAVCLDIDYENHCTCADCGCEFIEFERLDYDGYRIKGETTVYNKNGEECK